MIWQTLPSHLVSTAWRLFAELPEGRNGALPALKILQKILIYQLMLLQPNRRENHMESNSKLGHNSEQGWA